MKQFIGKTLAFLLTLLLLVGALPIVSSSAEEVSSENSNRYYFYRPDNWLNDYSDRVGIYWWEGTDACTDWPGYLANETDTPGIYYYDVPKDVTTFIWNNNIEWQTDPDSEIYKSEYSTCHIDSESYAVGESVLYPNGIESFNNMIFVLDLGRVETSETFGKYIFNGEWFYYYGNGEYGTAANKADASVVYTSDNIDLNSVILESATDDEATCDEATVDEPLPDETVVPTEPTESDTNLVPEGLGYSISNGEVTITGYTGTADSLNIPDTIEGYPVTSIGYSAFYSCDTLNTIYIPKYVSFVAPGAFENCSGLTSIFVDVDNTCYTSVGGVLFTHNTTELIAYPVGKTDVSYLVPDGVTKIGERAFRYCGYLENIYLPDSVEIIDSSAFSYTGYYYNESNWENGILYINHALVAAKSDISGDCVVKEGTEIIAAEAFAFCENFTSISIPLSVVQIGYGAFFECWSLSDIYYAGTEEQWDNVEIGYHIDGMSEINVHYVVDIYNELDYYLVGYINGADYGTDNNADIFGDYKFQNGVVTVELESDSYVIVKDSSGNYYYTNGWLGNDPGSAVLGDFGDYYNNKMHVPAGTVTFNFDHKTKTLSYVSSGSTDQTESTTVVSDPVETTQAIEITTAPTKTYHVAGSEGLCGVHWDVSQNEMSYDGDGTWSIVFTNIAMGTHQFLIIEDGVWGSFTYNLEGGGYNLANALITVEEDNATVIIGFDGEKAIIESVTYGCEMATDPTEVTTMAPELPSADLAFSGASLTLQDNLCINFKANESLFIEVGYENPYVIFELNGEEYTVSDYEIVSDKYVFDFSDISPANMNDTVKATLYATFDGVEYASETREYSVATYCYNMLSEYNTDDYAELRTLLVDLLNYGAQTQIYTNHNTDSLVNANLTVEQAAWGTSEAPVYETVQNLAYKTIDNPTVQWKGGGLNLQDSVTMRFKILAESTDNLTVKAETDTTVWTISAEEFEATTGGYYVFFDGLDASQMSEAVYLTVYDGDMPVSNTICYSIESYAYSKQSSTDTNLVNLLEAMMKYGNSASAYVN